MSGHQETIVAIAPVVAIVPLGADDPATTLRIHGRTVLELTVHRLLAATFVDRVIFALVGLPAASALAAIGDDGQRAMLTTATGPDRASAMVAALAQAGTSDPVLLCPPDRPLGPSSALDELVRRCTDTEAVAAAHAVRSTLKRADAGRVIATVPRGGWHSDAGAWAFRREALESALAASTALGRREIDPLGLALDAGLRVRLLDADPADLPIRTSDDARFAERGLEANS